MCNGICIRKENREMTKAQEIFNRLDNMELSKKAREVIENTDQIAIVDMFGTCETAEEVEEIVNEYF